MKIRKFISNVRLALLESVFPQNLTCHACDAELEPRSQEVYCNDCLRQLIRIESNVCSKCGKPIESAYEQLSDYRFKCKECQESFHYFRKHHAFALYEGSMKVSLMKLKYKGDAYQAVQMGKYLAMVLKDENFEAHYDYIVPVPIHYSRKWHRGYNQSELITKELLEVLKLKVPTNLLKRVKRTKKLKAIGREERKRILKDVFALDRKYQNQLKDKKILLVDDIYTTGSTLNACAKVLYESGCEIIDCVTVARAVE
jgi:ComF family protein